ncbi:hypothetical protein K7432_003731 [Basidiobolus ranarum]|uniref:Ragulator complex protein LAMTOR1 n=1 Tax=Basidiobolus ranarum TaxID=34480 RepID=A0ABR2WZL5_9FUNG
MGCCSSKQEDPRIVNESSQLLSGTQPSPPGIIHERMNYRDYETMNQEGIEDSLKKIVQRTAKNLIDISRTQVEKMKLQDTMERSKSYKTLIESCKTLPPKVMDIIDFPVAETPKSPREMLSQSGVVKGDIVLAATTLNKIELAFDQIQIQYIGEFVVPLTFTTPTGYD